MTKAQLIEALAQAGKTITPAQAKKLKVADLNDMLAKAQVANAPKTRKTKSALQPDDPKYNMYFVALPKVIRERVIKDHLCPRKLYQEYRREGRDHMVQKYA